MAELAIREDRLAERCTLGSTTTYLGDEHPYLRNCKVRIVAVMKRAAAPDYDPDRDGSYLRDEAEIARAGISRETTRRRGMGSSSRATGPTNTEAGRGRKRWSRSR